jgi:hypothetical protein
VPEVVIGADDTIVASGTWAYEPSVIKQWEYIDDQGVLFVDALGEEDSIWTGTFRGTSYDVFLAELNTETEIKELPYGVIFFEGSVNGKKGTLMIDFAPGYRTPERIWSGVWEILSGTGKLKNLQGQGTWEGPGGMLEYSGEIYYVKGKDHDR